MTGSRWSLIERAECRCSSTSSCAIPLTVLQQHLSNLSHGGKPAKGHLCDTCACTFDRQVDWEVLVLLQPAEV